MVARVTMILASDFTGALPVVFGLLLWPMLGLLLCLPAIRWRVWLLIGGVVTSVCALAWWIYVEVNYSIPRDTVFFGIALMPLGAGLLCILAWFGVRWWRSLSMDEYRILYGDNGFFWNQELADFVKQYGNREIVSRKGVKVSRPNVIQFCQPILIRQGRNSAKYGDVANYLGEDVAPVGISNGLHTELLLTKSGRLFGFCDYLIVRWGEDDSWRSAVNALINGVKPEEVGLVDPGEIF